MVSRNLERANENDGFKMTALEIEIFDKWLISLDHVTYEDLLYTCSEKKKKGENDDDEID